MWARSAAVLIATASAGLFACTLLVDTSGLGLPHLSDARVSDGPATTDDAGDAATTDAGDGASRTCAPEAGEFCDDFDTDPLAARWTGVDVSGGTASLEDGGLSPPFAFVARTNGSGADAMLAKAFEPIPSRVHCEFDQKVPAPLPAIGVHYAGLETDGPNGQSVLTYLDLEPNGQWRVQEWSYTSAGGGSVPQQSDATFPLDRWVHVAYETDWATFFLWIDGALSATVSGLTRVAQPQGRSLLLGIIWASAAGSAVAFFDNVRCTTLP